MAQPFIYETSNNRLQRAIALLLVILILSVGLAVLLTNVSQEESGPWYEAYIPDIVHNITPWKLFLTATMSGMVIFPLPVELTFYFGLKQGNPVLFATLAVLAGAVIGNCISYLLGLKLSKHVMYLLSTKDIYRVRREVNRFGPYAILVLNIIPAPADLLTFGLGMIRYNAKRLFVFLFIGTAIKYTIIATAVHYLTH